MKLTPLNKHLLLEPVKAQDKTPGGIVLPEKAQERPRQGLVIDLASDSKFVDAEKVFGTPPVKTFVGKTVLYKAYAGSEVKVDGKEYLLMPEDDVLAVLEE